MNASDPVENAFNRFLTTVADNRTRAQREQRRNERIIHDKDLKLIPVRQLLKRFVDLNVVVANASRHRRGETIIAPPVSLAVTEGASSPSWAPGNSLFLDHPAELEIAIPNDKDIPEQGVIVIRCSSDHPDAAMFNGPFRSIDEACLMLAEFLAKQTEHMNHQDFEP